MEKRISLDGRTVSYDEPEQCPLCGHAIQPVELYFQFFHDNQNRSFIAALYLCKHCYQPFTVLSSFSESSHRANMLYIGPKKFTPQQFDEKVTALSPQFVKIYNQALAAEAGELDEIAGLGYRKAVEFLVKDFCIHKAPEEAEKIKAKPLSQCISTYIDNPQIQALAKGAAWIGNDEAHYIRKQEARDITDMKQFIQAMVYFVGMVLISEDAASMSPA